jgi:alpha-L-fucosidase
MNKIVLIYSFIFHFGINSHIQSKTVNEKFEPTVESLKKYKCPDWFRDAKFGIWSHWGPQSVPMVGDWYAKNMYVKGARRDQYNFHLEKYGHPSEFGFKDIIPLWKAEKFDPERLMKLYKAAGARYFVSMGVHHDNFDLWNSKYQKWNSVNMGPKRDIISEWQKAAKKEGLKFGISEHLAASYSWFQTSHGSDKDGPKAGIPYDGANPKWQDLYHSKADSSDTKWYTSNREFHDIWLKRMTDLIDNYDFDLLYSDGPLPFGERGLKAVSHLYNVNMDRNKGKLEAVYNSKDASKDVGDGKYIEGIGVQDVERGGLAEIKSVPWQTDTSIGDWFYNVNWKANDTKSMYRSINWIIQTLIDVVSKNGNMLLNVIQRPDGSLDPEVEKLLADMATWMDANGEAIFETRPWKIFGEGRAITEVGKFKEDFGFKATDIRFTQSKDGKNLYAMTLGWPKDGKIVIKSLAKSDLPGNNKIKSINLLGYKGAIKYEQTKEGLIVTVPVKPVNSVACCLKINGKELTPVSSIK